MFKRRLILTLLMILAIPLLLAACGGSAERVPQPAQSDSPIELNGRLVLVEFYADW